ncbi:glycoside hydrolase family 172 protein [Fulvitalea axinellae]
MSSLLNEMTTTDQIAKWPEATYRCAQFSSYDRRSKTPNPADGRAKKSNPDSGTGWFANNDSNNFIRTDSIDGRAEMVMMDHNAPGAIVRFWLVTTPGVWNNPGKIRIYIDSAQKPTVEMDAWELIGGNGLAGFPFSYIASDATIPAGRRGRNLYLPIPYAKSCKVTWEKGPGPVTGWSSRYYNINYREYKSGTDVESFSLDVLKKNSNKILRTGAKLIAEKSVEGKSKTVKDHILKPEGISELKIKGERALRNIRLKISANDYRQALRSTVIKISFDGNRTVWCPIGEFFGIGNTPTENHTYYVSNSAENIMTARWPMPFQKNAKLEIINHGDQDVNIEELSVVSNKWNWDENSMYFYGTWFEKRHIDATHRQDINFVSVEGKGVYVGDALSLFNSASGRAWWGEGDEKIFVDGESFPSHFGTGSEDYYGYAWARSESFYHPFIAQPSGSGNKKVGPVTNARYRILDAIPFNKSIRFYMELWHWEEVKINYAPATFFYAQPGAKVNIQPDIEAVKYKIAKTQSEFLQ